MRQDNLNDITSLGGLPLYALVAFVFLVTGHGDFFVHMTAALALAYVVTATTRILYFRERPDKQTYKNILERIDASSFPSLHAMRSTIFAAITASFFESTLLTLVFGIAIVAVGITRITLKRHHPADVVVGMFIGMLLAYVTLTWISPAVLSLGAGVIP